MQAVTAILIHVAVGQFVLVNIVGVLPRRRFFDALIVGIHVERNDVGQAIVVHVGGVVAHRKPAGVAQLFGRFVGKLAVLIIKVQVVIFVKIIRDVDILPAIVVIIGHGHAQPIAHWGHKQTRFSGHVNKFSWPLVVFNPLIFKQIITR